MTRLPVPGSDEGQWGALLNEFLQVAHHEDGTLRDVSRTVLTVADLSGVRGKSDGECILVLGSSSPGDGGGGYFWWDESSNQGEDGGLVVAPDPTQPGRWHRLTLSGQNSRVIPQWWYRETDADYAIAINKAIDALPEGGGVVHLPAGRYHLKSPILLRKGVTLEGAGPFATVLVVDKDVCRVEDYIYAIEVVGQVGWSIRSLRIEPNQPCRGGIRVRDSGDFSIRDVRISGVIQGERDPVMLLGIHMSYTILGYIVGVKVVGIQETALFLGPGTNAIQVIAGEYNGARIGIHWAGQHFVHLFTVEAEAYQRDLEVGELSLEFRQEFESHCMTLSDKLTIETQAQGSEWRINDDDTGIMYLVKRQGEAENAVLSIYYFYEEPEDPNAPVGASAGLLATTAEGNRCKNIWVGPDVGRIAMVGCFIEGAVLDEHGKYASIGLQLEGRDCTVNSMHIVETKTPLLLAGTANTVAGVQVGAQAGEHAVVFQEHAYNCSVHGSEIDPSPPEVGPSVRYGGFYNQVFTSSFGDPKREYFPHLAVARAHALRHLPGGDPTETEYKVLPFDEILQCENLSDNLILELPYADNVPIGKRYTIKYAPDPNGDVVDLRTVTVRPWPGQKIDSYTGAVLHAGSAIEIAQTRGSRWLLISQYGQVEFS